MTSTITDFRAVLDSGGTILLDGAMGTELDKRGAPGRSACNLTNPAEVVRVHRDYLAAGSVVLITNTLTMNRIFVETHRIRIDLREVNRAGVSLAKQAAKEISLGSSGDPDLTVSSSRI